MVRSPGEAHRWAGARSAFGSAVVSQPSDRGRRRRGTPFGSEPFAGLREALWLEIVGEAATTDRSLIFTFAPEPTVHPEFRAHASPEPPIDADAIIFGIRCQSVWVARMWLASVIPRPRARAPAAPCVEVWLSAQTTIIPGWLMPCSGPTTCTMPCPWSFRPNIWTPKSEVYWASDSTMYRRWASGICEARAYWWAHSDLAP